MIWRPSDKAVARKESGTAAPLSFTATTDKGSLDFPLLNKNKRAQNFCEFIKALKALSYFKRIPRKKRKELQHGCHFHAAVTTSAERAGQAAADALTLPANYSFHWSMFLIRTIWTVRVGSVAIFWSGRSLASVAACKGTLKNPAMLVVGIALGYQYFGQDLAPLACLPHVPLNFHWSMSLFPALNCCVSCG